jgi:hypothetical protein
MQDILEPIELTASELNAVSGGLLNFAIAIGNGNLNGDLNGNGNGNGVLNIASGNLNGNGNGNGNGNTVVV